MANEISDRILEILKQDPELVKGSLTALEKIFFTLGKLNNEGKLDNLLRFLEKLAEKIYRLNDSEIDNLAYNIQAIAGILAKTRLDIDLQEIGKIIERARKAYSEIDKGLTIRQLLALIRSPEFARALNIFIELSKALGENRRLS